MKILVLHTFYKRSGGEDTVVLNEVKLLQNNGHEVELLQFDNSQATLLKLIFLPFNIKSFIRTKRKIRSFRPDVVHIHNMHFAASPSVIYAAHSLKIPVVLTLHNYRLLCPSASLFFNGKIFLESLSSGFPWKAVKIGAYKNSTLLTFWLAFANYIHQELKTYNKVNAFIVLGVHSKELFASSNFQVSPEKFIVKPNFTESVKSNFFSEEDKYFLFVGRLTEEKGIETLLNAFSKTGTKLKIVGSGPLEPMVLNAIRNNSNIEYLGQQPAGNIAQLLEHAEALIFPSRWFETFGMVLIEAFSKSIPVIASALGNIENIVTSGKNGLTFEAGNDQDLRLKIDYYKNLPPEVKERYKKIARETYENTYSPLANYNQLIKIYNDAINKHSYRR